MRRYKHFIDVLLYSSLVKLSMGECELSGTNFSCDGEDVKTIIYEYNSKNTGNIGITNIEIVNSSSSVLGSFLGFLENETREKVKVMKINDCELDEIASDVFSQFEALEVLDLSGNRISNLEFLTTSPKSLKEIYLGHNKIAEITDSFSEMENLQIIDMSYSTIETIDFIVFKNNPHLELVNVSHNNIQSSESKEYLKNIKCVDLSYNNLAKYDNIPSYCLDLSYTNMTGYRWYNIAEKNKTVYIEKFFYSGNDHLQLSATNIKNETLPIEIKYLNISGFTGSISSDLLLDKVKVRKELIMKDSVIPSLEKSVYDFKILFYDEGTNTTFDLSNCSITDISILYFANYILGRLNLCHNKFKTLEDNVFKDAYIIQLDLCNSSIEAIADNAFQGLHTVLLNLSMNNIEKIGFLKIVPTVKILDLSHNSISSISSDDFSNLKHLRVLDLRDNLISTLEEGSFKLQSIEVINLNNNKIIGIRSMTFNGIPTLREINLQGNPLVTIESNAFGSLNRIQTIDLGRMKVADIQPHSFNGLQNLSVIYLNDNNIRQLALATFVNVPNLREIHLEGNCLENVESLNSLKFDTLAIQICDNAQSNTISNPNLRNLYVIESNLSKFQSSGLYNLVELHFVDPQSTLQATAFSGLFNIKYIHGKDVFRNVKVLPKYMFRDMRSLVALDLSELVIEVIEPETFIGLVSVEDLSLSRNRIVEFQNSSFSGLSNLKKLDVSDNYISVIGADSFIGVQKIEILRMDNNKISVIPVGALRDMKQLSTLNLGYNKIYQLPTGAFSNLGNLRTLDLSNNRIETICSELFYPLVNLEVLNLGRNKLSYISGSDLISYNPQLKSMVLNGNNFECGKLTNILYDLRKRNVSVQVEENGDFHMNNIDGIYCRSICS